MLFASATLPSTTTETFDLKRIAVLTNVAAGRAWSATAVGSATATSLRGLELAGTTRLLRRPRHIVQVLPCRGHHRRGDGSLDKRGIDQPDVAVAATLFQEMADRENRAAEVGQHDHSLAAIRPGDGGSNDVAGGAQGAVRSATRRLDTDFSPGHLRGREPAHSCGRPVQSRPNQSHSTEAAANSRRPG